MINYSESMNTGCVHPRVPLEEWTVARTYPSRRVGVYEGEMLVDS
jgi:hypothetical protein